MFEWLLKESTGTQLSEFCLQNWKIHIFLLISERSSCELYFALWLSMLEFKNEKRCIMRRGTAGPNNSMNSKKQDSVLWSAQKFAVTDARRLISNTSQRCQILQNAWIPHTAFCFAFYVLKAKWNYCDILIRNKEHACCNDVSYPLIFPTSLFSLIFEALKDISFS